MPAFQPDPIDDRTPLMLAACAGDLCELLDLILEGAEVDRQDSNHWTALSHACRHGHCEIVQQLLDSGADPNIHPSYSMNETPLSLAAQGGFFGIVRLLIAHDADPNVFAGISAVRPECYARRHGHHEIADFLRHHEDARLKVTAAKSNIYEPPP